MRSASITRRDRRGCLKRSKASQSLGVSTRSHIFRGIELLKGFAERAIGRRDGLASEGADREREREGLSGKVICTAAAPRQSYLAVCLSVPAACRPLHLWHVNPFCCIAITSQPFLLILIGRKILHLWSLTLTLEIEHCD